MDPSVIIIVGTQGDKKEKREISREEGMKMAYYYGCSYFETSAKTGDNLEEIINFLISQLRFSFYYSKILSFPLSFPPIHNYSSISNTSTTINVTNNQVSVFIIFYLIL